MNRANIFRTAHVNARNAKAANGGDYAAYFAFYLREGYSASKNTTMKVQAAEIMHIIDSMNLDNVEPKVIAYVVLSLEQKLDALRKAKIYYAKKNGIEIFLFEGDKYLMIHPQRGHMSIALEKGAEIVAREEVQLQPIEIIIPAIVSKNTVTESNTTKSTDKAVMVQGVDYNLKPVSFWIPKSAIASDGTVADWIVKKNSSFYSVV